MEAPLNRLFLLCLWQSHATALSQLQEKLSSEKRAHKESVQKLNQDINESASVQEKLRYDLQAQERTTEYVSC